MRGACPMCRRSLTPAQLHSKEFFHLPASKSGPSDADDNASPDEDVTSSTKLRHVICTMDSFQE